ncbi:hypothetical protein Tco_0079408 [Tanacetum coccineum]
MTSLADKSLPMLEKHLYDSWKSRMELYMMNRPHGRMILASVEKGPLVWPSITEDGVTRLKEYVELTPAEAIQADCDIKAINIILQGLPTEIYALVSQHRVAKDLWEKIKLLMQGTSLTKQERECKLYDEFDKFTYKKGETLHEYYLRTNPDPLALVASHQLTQPAYQSHLHPHQQSLSQHHVSPYQSSQFVTPYQHQQFSTNHSTPLSITYPTNEYQSTVHHNVYSQQPSIPQSEYAPITYQQQQPEFSQPDSSLVVPVFQKGDDPIDAINHMMSFLTAVRPHHAPTVSYYEQSAKDFENKKYHLEQVCRQHGETKGQLFVTIQRGGHIVQAMHNAHEDKGMTQAKDCSYGQFSRKASDALTEEPVQNSNSSAQQDVLILSMFDQITTQVTHCNTVNKALTTELDRYKEEIKDLKEKQNVENSFSGSNEQFDEIVRLKQNLFEQVQEKDCLMKTVSELKNELKLEENRNIDREIALEKKIKQLDNIIFKRGQSAQTVHMMTKSKICYDHSSKQAIGFEKPFCLKKARESKPKLYDGNTILKMDPIVVPDSDETIELSEKSRSKMLLKEQDPLFEKHKVNTKPINYAILNNDYYKRFVRQTDLYCEQAYWKATSVPALDPSHSSTTVIVEVPKELPTVSMVNTSLKELKRYLTGFDQVVKERTTATAHRLIT